MQNQISLSTDYCTQQPLYLSAARGAGKQRTELKGFSIDSC